jgi:RNA recognition motif-containing protein
LKPTYKEPPKKTEGYTRAYIGNLSWDISEEDIRSLFADCKIDAIRFSLNKTTGEFQGFGHVDFTDDESLERALKLNQHIVLGRLIKIAYAVTKSKSEEETDKITKRSKARNGKRKAFINAQP